MTREQMQIEAEYYLPHPPDPTLGVEEYYYLQWTATGSRVLRVWALDVLPYEHSTQYGIYQQRGGRMVRISTEWGDDPFHGPTMGDLYDNREDCKEQTHGAVEWWPELRAWQREEGLI